MKNVLILGANGQIARIVEKRVLVEQSDVHLTLFLRQKSRLANLADNSRVTLIDGNMTDYQAVKAAMHGQDIVYIAAVDHTPDNVITRNVIKASREQGVQRIIESSLLGLYNEVTGEYGRWNYQMVKSGLPAAIHADELLAQSGIAYTTLRFPWLNDRDEIKYQLTHRNEPYVGVSGSRQSMADVIVKIIADPTFLANDSVGIADAATQGATRPVY
ncbi:NAD(P)H-binding protein [Lactiplantibacillus pentosus]|uniref:NAD-dependent epimerase/dehydratase family protein n=1 Tax=Lactiplantibacillus pentosus TaxID=1589 RepID=A0AB37RMN4_LACPE|nr:NAD(P)H-binding protein [Lactiplantibacillus pentosus]RMW41673.1 NAD-dependent epimerase/dehydratase family protein [Lactiplantibacillus pentosus]RMW49167.1 NAD-dependent epimerase/dehydratase family protein [Lactiplantibacillus pentosus]RMW50452.1 NAD-dependent epimerase/dehydratase family protein [Lactiplantibacillus pentosus]RMW56001.1 NAD-dependent epimerase/dehydratase family protein [Lactiplantibacillus pentosus]